MSPHFHYCIVWIDHREARLFHFNDADVERLVLNPEEPTRRIHHQASSTGGHEAADRTYLDAVAEGFANAGVVLISGPASAKTELIKHVHQFRPRLVSSIAGIETVERPTDGALVAYARRYFGVGAPRLQRAG